MKKLSAILMILSGFIFINCGPLNSTMPPHATPAVQDTEFCAAADAHLVSLSCVSNPYTKRGKTFTQFCQETQAAGIYLNPKCLSTVTSCDQINQCTGTSL